MAASAGPTVTDLMTGAGPACPREGTTRMVSVVVFAAPFLAPAVGAGAANTCGCFGSGTTNVTSWLIFIWVIAPKNAMVPA